MKRYKTICFSKLSQIWLTKTTDKFSELYHVRTPSGYHSTPVVIRGVRSAEFPDSVLQMDKWDFKDILLRTSRLGATVDREGSTSGNQTPAISITSCDYVDVKGS